MSYVESVDFKRKTPSCCTGVSMSYIVAVNVFTLLIGLGIMGLGAYMYIQFTSTFRAIVSEDAVIGTIATGVIMAFISILGMVGALRHSRILLSGYLLLLIALILAQVVASVLTLTYLEVIDNVTAPGSAAQQVTEDTAITINNFFLNTYTTCCYENADLCNLSLAPSDLGYCTEVLPCGDVTPTNTTSCLQDLSGGEEFVTDYPVENAVCAFLAEVQERDGFRIVGDPRNGESCGGGDPSLFERQMFEYIQDNFMFIAYVVLFFGFLELCLIFFTTFLLCTKRVKDLEDVDMYPFAQPI